MAERYLFLETHSIKSMLKKTLQHNLEKITFYLSDFMQTKDVESLHQYRVNIRMARSICMEFREFMDEKRQDILSKAFKKLQQETNDMRDIDVFIEELEAYKSMVDEAYVKDIVHLQEQLLEEKKEAYETFERHFPAKLQSKILEGLNTLKDDDKLCLPKSEEKLFRHFKTVIEKRLKKIAKISKKLDLETPNERYHKLRLHYKKLRYTCDAIDLTAFSKSFKPLQSAFGKVQDKTTQIARLKRYNALEHPALAHILSLLEQALIQDKSICIEKSSKENIEALRVQFETIIST